MRLKSDAVQVTAAPEDLPSGSGSVANDELPGAATPFDDGPNPYVGSAVTDLSISQMADAFHVTMRTLRFYEEKSLLSPRRVGNRRFYDEASCARLRLILKGKAMGFGLDEVAELVTIVESKRTDGERALQLRSLCERQRAHLVERRKVLDEQIEAPDAVINGLMAL